MSVLDVIATLRDCLQDDTVGLVSRVRDLAGATPGIVDPIKIRQDFNFVKWKLSGPLNTKPTAQPTTFPNVMLRPVRWQADPKQANIRSGLAVVQVGIEWFDSDTDILQDNLTIGAVALVRVIDGLRDYSDAHGGTVIDVKSFIDIFFGEFDGPVSSGILATIQIEERSAHE